MTGKIGEKAARPKPRDGRSVPLTQEERRDLRENYPAGDLDQLAGRLGITLHALRDHAWRMGVKRLRRPGEAASGGVVALAMQRRTPLEQAWK